MPGIFKYIFGPAFSLFGENDKYKELYGFEPPEPETCRNCDFYVLDTKPENNVCVRDYRKRKPFDGCVKWERYKCP